MRTLAQVLLAVGTASDFAGVDVTGPNTRGNFSVFPLHVAAVSGDCEAVRVLVDAGAVINQPGEHGYTPLMEAVEQGQVEVVELLISLGAKPIPNENGDTPSGLAALMGNESLAQSLLARGY